jgi:hypothetical protein
MNGDDAVFVQHGAGADIGPRRPPSRWVSRVLTAPLAQESAAE